MPDTEDAPSGEAQRLILGAYLLELMAEANGGREPQNIWQYRRAGRRFGLKIRFLPPETLPSAMLRQGKRAGQQGFIYVRRTRDMSKLRLDILHELAEGCLRWEGVPTWITSCSRHEVAVRVEDLSSRKL